MPTKTLQNAVPRAMNHKMHELLEFQTFEGEVNNINPKYLKIDQAKKVEKILFEKEIKKSITPKKKVMRKEQTCDGLHAPQGKGFALQALDARALGLRAQLAGDGVEGIEHGGQEYLLVRRHRRPGELYGHRVVLHRLQVGEQRFSVLRRGPVDRAIVHCHHSMAN